MMHHEKPLPERVAILETQVTELRSSIKDMLIRESAIEKVLGTIEVTLGVLTTKLEEALKERSVWRNPLIWTNLISLSIAVFAFLRK